MTVHQRLLAPTITVLRKREWGGFSASLVETDPGRFVGSPTTAVWIMFHLGQPALVRCDYDGHLGSRVQTHGRFDVAPIGIQPSWEDDDPTLSFNVALSPCLLESAARTMSARRKASDLGPKISEEDERLFGVARLLKSEVESETPDDLFADSLASVMAVRLLERYGMGDRVTRQATLSRPQFRRVSDYIEAHLGSAIRLSTLAALVGLSESHFRVLFRQTAGRPVHAYVVERRLVRARELLEAGTLPIAQVALETGFCHQSHLAKALRRHCGRTPSQLLRNARERP